MPPTEPTNNLQQELSEALDELHSSLQRASEATGVIRGMLPKLAATGALFDEIESLIRAGRERIGVSGGDAAGTTTQYARPTLVVPNPATRPAPVLQAAEAPGTDQPAAPASEHEEPGVTCFRLEFESQSGPLDLRTVDDAVGEHPAVRDVALLDYDGRRATLKVWIVETASPAEVQRTLQERAEQLFGASHDVTIVALEDAA